MRSKSSILPGLKQKPRKTLSSEEQATIIATSTGDLSVSLEKPIRVLLLKPFQDSPTLSFSPPLGLLHLAANLREKFDDQLIVDVVDMKLHRFTPEWLPEKLADFQPDIVGVSSLNYEAAVSHRISSLVHRWNSSCITVIGGPYPLHQSRVIFAESDFDWVFEGTSDRTFPEAVRRYAQGESPGTDLPGYSWRNAKTEHITTTIDVISDIDSLPMPAWDFCEFDEYAKCSSFNPMSKKGRYAVLFTSRGCPYLCSYCHDIFTKKYNWQSTEKVIGEIEYLYTNYGVNDFQIVDDIFNLHKPRVLEIMREVDRRWPGQMRFSFPNGLRADILDQEVIDAMVKAGTYYTALAVETVTPRLQNMIEKYLDVDKTRWAIDEFDRQGVSVAGFFMLGFPTETIEELKATVKFAQKSGVGLAYFFAVVPQPETPMYEQAKLEGAEQLEIIRRNEMEGGSYRSSQPWYSLAYDFDLAGFIRKANWQTYMNVPRVSKLLWRWPKHSLLRNISNISALLLPGWGKLRQHKWFSRPSSLPETVDKNPQFPSRHSVSID